MFPTPDHECIDSNLEQLIFKWKGKLSGATLKAIDNWRVHVRKDCLSGIQSFPVGQPGIRTSLK